MGFQELYQSKLTSAEKAVSVIKSGDWIDYGWTTGHPVALDKALAARMNDLTDIKIRGGICMWVPEIFKIEDPKAHFCWNSWHMGGIERKAIDSGFAFYAPIRYAELPRYYRENIVPGDVAMFQHHALGPPGRTRGEDQIGQIVGGDAAVGVDLGRAVQPRVLVQHQHLRTM